MTTNAQAALDKLTEVSSRATAARSTVLVKAYGVGTDSAAVTLAARALRVLAGEAKPRGGAAQQINDTIALLDADTVTDKAAVEAARTIKAALAAKAKAARAELAAERKAAKDIANDRGAAKGARVAAFDLMSEIDSRSAADKVASHAARLDAAIVSAKDGGVSTDRALSALVTVYGLDAIADVLASYQTERAA